MTSLGGQTAPARGFKLINKNCRYSWVDILQLELPDFDGDRCGCSKQIAIAWR